MITRLNLQLPLNSLSFGNVSFNLLRELYKRKVQCVLYPRGQPDLAAYKLDPGFGQWIERATNTRFTKLDRRVPTFNLWHIQDSQFKLSDRNVLLSFHETDSPTESEVNLVNQQDFTFFTSSWSVDNFTTYGAQNVGFVPLGVDEDFVPTTERLVPEDVTHWILTGKAEARKNTQLVIQTWAKRYGGNRAHQLTLCVTNPFFKPEAMNAFYSSCFTNGQRPFNVNILPYLKTNAEVCQLLNSADIDLSISSAEGWGLGGFNATALGKWSVVSNVTGHRDWATPQNSILVEPSGMKPSHDGVFFLQGQPFNQGNMYNFTAEQLDEAFTRAEAKAKTPNPAGARLRETHTYAKTVDRILEKIESL